MQFDIVGQIEHVEVIAVQHAIRDLQRLRHRFGLGRWRKLKGTATIALPSGEIRIAELHWYEASGIGRRLMKVKRFLDK